MKTRKELQAIYNYKVRVGGQVGGQEYNVIAQDELEAKAELCRYFQSDIYSMVNGYRAMEVISNSKDFADTVNFTDYFNRHENLRRYVTPDGYYKGGF